MSASLIIISIKLSKFIPAFFAILGTKECFVKSILLIMWEKLISTPHKVLKTARTMLEAAGLKPRADGVVRMPDSKDYLERVEHQNAGLWSSSRATMRH